MRLRWREWDESDEIARRVQIRLSNIFIQEDGSFMVVDEIYLYPSSQRTQGRYNFLEKVNGTWEITNANLMWVIHWD